ncbi:RPS6 protein kinase [Blastocystis sp. ATCC 50177/Nand II]|uniref:non-specific serine/threonine protein kinase n=1 Tax=Blastocystis sp. subtype 1 (strain ATCC 50177 / NandII) TaxID=478820 RepID=A0A196SG71_BLAHN|nr:RPS6 protein kinase [Blastocystis sp. ATCC 50177/Nand II]
MSQQRATTFIRHCYIVPVHYNVDNILYAIEVTACNVTWTVYRTFSAFQILKNMLVQANVPNLPPFPNTQYIDSSTLEGINSIRIMLENWLHAIMENEYVQHVNAFQEFMRAEANRPPNGIQEIDFSFLSDNDSFDAKSPGSGDDAYYRNEYPELANSTVTVSDFEILKVIGKGSFGKVFQVRKHGESEIYAMKVLNKAVIKKKNQIEHTKTERNILGKIDHPFIVGMKYAFQTKDKLYFVLDYCPGGELFYHLGKARKFSEERSRFYAAEITLALEHLHKMGIVYRDLKPENVLLTEEGHVRLTDFGLSKEGISQADKGAQSFCGTPEYLAPEILNRTGHGQAVDWWSLGALLYEMLTGWPPFYSRDQERLFNKIKRSSVEIPPNLSPETADILQKLLQKDPKQRLGGGPDDAASVKAHPFFKSIDWDKLYRKELPVPYLPEVKDKLDTSMFSAEFTNLPIVSPSSYNRPCTEEIAFPGFSYVGSYAHELQEEKDNAEMEQEDAEEMDGDGQSYASASVSEYSDVDMCEDYYE